MAWEDRIPFEAIQSQFGLDEAAVVALMRSQLKRGSYRLWRRRVQGRKSKHAALPLMAEPVPCGAVALAAESPLGLSDAPSCEPQPCSVKADW